MQTFYFYAGTLDEKTGEAHTSYYPHMVREAESYAASLSRELRDDGYHTAGSARDGQIYAERDSGDLGRVIEILPAD